MVVINLISFSAVILTFILFYFLKFDKMIFVIRKISDFLLRNFKKRRSVVEIFYYSRKMNNFLGIKSCLKICISQKIIFSSLGYKVDIINGVKHSENNSIKGHAWIQIDNRPITHIDDDISGYSESFII